jgi:hypothetical protein
MKFGWFFEADETDNRMTATGWLPEAVASESLNRSVSQLRVLGHQLVLRTEKIRGRTYYCEEDVQEMAAGNDPEQVRDAKHWDLFYFASTLHRPMTEHKTQQPPDNPGMGFLKKVGG